MTASEKSKAKTNPWNGAITSLWNLRNVYDSRVPNFIMRLPSS
jgi:hypothetical protein